MYCLYLFTFAVWAFFKIFHFHLSKLVNHHTYKYNTYGYDCQGLFKDSFNLVNRGPILHLVPCELQDPYPHFLGRIQFFIVFPHRFSVSVMSSSHPSTALNLYSPSILPIKIKSPFPVRVELVFPYWFRQSKGFGLKRKRFFKLTQ